jgi:hypothetical protein
MWTTLQPEIISRFPRHGSNGTRQNGVASVQTAPLDPAEWKKRIEDLEAIRNYQNDWDGQGAEAPSPELMESAISLAQLLLHRAIDAPSCVVPGVNGTVVFEWQGENGSYLEIEVTAPNRADGCLTVPGKPTEHWTLQ